MNLVFVYGKCSYYRHVESAFYCFLLADQKQRGSTTPREPVLFREGRGLGAQESFVILCRPGNPGRLLIEPNEARAGLLSQKRQRKL